MKDKLKYLTDYKTILILQLLASILFIFSLNRTGIILKTWTILLIGLFLLLLIVMYIFVRPGKIINRNIQIRPLIGKILSVLISIALIFLSIQVRAAKSSLDDISTMEYEVVTYSLVVLKKSDYKDIKDLINKKIGVNKVTDQYFIDKAIENLKSEISYTQTEVDNHLDLSNLLYDKKTDAILLNEAHREFIETFHSKFSKQTRVIWTTEIQYYQDQTQETNFDITKDAFNIYLSGIDSRGSIEQVSRSDVNLLLTVNPVSRQILMTSIPRDYYVTLADANQKDKLTHSGLTGTPNTVHTVENLLSIDIRYYARLNFASLVSVVDALDGIDVYSDKDLRQWTGKNIVEGMNHMDGETALAFSRERHAYQSGDRHRTQNQQAVLQAIINKMMTPSILLNYSSILDATKESFRTNLPMDDIASLVRMQLEDSKSWKFYSYMLDGKGSMQYGGYYMPKTKLYYMIPDEDTITQAELYINNVLSGKSFKIN